MSLYVDLAPGELKTSLAEAGFPGFWPEELLSFDLAYKRDDTAVATDTVLTLTGKAPQDLPDFLKVNEVKLREYL